MAEKEKTKELERMLRNPRSAILSMTAPLFVAFIIANLQLFIDSYWCTGLGSSAMAAITVSGPVYWVVTDVGAGLGVGVSTAVARALGAENKARADSLASQMIVFTVILSVLTSVIMFLAAGPLLHYMSDSPDIGLCMEYVLPNLVFSFPLILNGILIATLRAEGAAKRSMTISLAASVINLALDPVFIYGFGWGIGGAALATCVSYTVTTLVILYWYLAGKMYITPRFRHFRFNREQLWDIFSVGIPHMLELVLVPLMMVPQNAIVVRTGGEAGIVCNVVPFRYITLCMIPAQALCAAMVPVTSAALGQKNYPKALFGFGYTAKIAVSIALVLSVLLIVFADPLTLVFTSSSDMTQYHEEFTKVLRIYAFTTAFMAVVSVGSGILQTLKFSQLATATIFARECMFIAFYYIGSYWGMDGIYWALLVAEGAGAVMMAAFALYGIRERRKEYPGKVEGTGPVC